MLQNKIYEYSLILFSILSSKSICGITVFFMLLTRIFCFVILSTNINTIETK